MTEQNKIRSQKHLIPIILGHMFKEAREKENPRDYLQLQAPMHHSCRTCGGIVGREGCSNQRCHAR